MFNITIRICCNLYYFLIIGWLQYKCIYEIPPPHSSLITEFVTWAMPRVPLVKQEMFTLPVFTPCFSGVRARVARSFVFCAVFCRSLFVLLSFCLFTIVLSVLRFTDSDYPFGIFKLFLQYGTITNINRQ
jgi:hypothetical protein